MSANTKQVQSPTKAPANAGTFASRFFPTTPKHAQRMSASTPVSGSGTGAAWRQEVNTDAENVTQATSPTKSENWRASHNRGNSEAQTTTTHQEEDKDEGVPLVVIDVAAENARKTAAIVQKSTLDATVDPFVESRDVVRVLAGDVGHSNNAADVGMITGENAQAIFPADACVFVANLNAACHDEQLRFDVAREFSRWGRCWVKVKRDAKGLPFAFVQFEIEAHADEAVPGGRQIIIQGRQCRTERAKVNRTLYLSRLDNSPILPEEAIEVMNEQGPIEIIFSASKYEKELYGLREGLCIKWKQQPDCEKAFKAFRSHSKYHLEQLATQGRRPSTIHNHSLNVQAMHQQMAYANAYAGVPAMTVTSATNNSGPCTPSTGTFPVNAMESNRQVFSARQVLIHHGPDYIHRATAVRRALDAGLDLQVVAHIFDPSIYAVPGLTLPAGPSPIMTPPPPPHGTVYYMPQQPMHWGATPSSSGYGMNSPAAYHAQPSPLLSQPPPQFAYSPANAHATLEKTAEDVAAATAGLTNITLSG